MSYKAGIIKAITELKDRTDSSSVVIKKHMQAAMPADKKWLNATFLSALKKAVADGDLVQVKNSKKKVIAASKPKKKDAPKKNPAQKKKADFPRRRRHPRKRLSLPPKRLPRRRQPRRRSQ
ncbi:hypothetical protein ACHAWF_007537 [Thalassiosira exigua]